MHSHDFDLIAALAEGSLTAETASASEADVAACVRCSSELEAHRSALAAVAAAPPAALTEAEAAALRASVAEAIGLSLEPVPEAASPRRRVPWGAIAVAGASLAAIVAVVPVLNLLSASSDDGAGDDIVAATFAVSGGESRVETDAEAPPAGEDPAPEAAALATEDLAEAQPTTTVPASTTMAAGAAASGRDLEDLWASPDELRATLQDQVTRGAHPCVDAAVEVLGPDLSVISVPVVLDGAAVVAYVTATEEGDRLVAFAPDDCMLVLVLP